MSSELATRICQSVGEQNVCDLLVIGRHWYVDLNSRNVVASDLHQISSSRKTTLSDFRLVPNNRSIWSTRDKAVWNAKLTMEDGKKMDVVVKDPGPILPSMGLILNQEMLRPLNQLKHFVLETPSKVQPFLFSELPRSLLTFRTSSLPMSSITNSMAEWPAIGSTAGATNSTRRTRKPSCARSKASTSTEKDPPQDFLTGNESNSQEADISTLENGGYVIWDLPPVLTDLKLVNSDCAFLPSSINMWPVNLTRLELTTTQWSEMDAEKLKSRILHANEIVLHGTPLSQEHWLCDMHMLL